jgi:hypothetical protein
VSLLHPRSSLLAAVCVLSTVTPSFASEEAPPTTATELAERVKARGSNEGRTGTMTFTLENERGQTRTREARMFHHDAGQTVRLAIHFQKPAAIEGTAFLSHEQEDPDATDETWLYLPSTERVRRIPASDRSDSFMGTDLSYGDVTDDFKFEPSEWDLSGFGTKDTSEGMRYTLSGKIRTPELAKDIGYGGFTAEIDPQTWFPVMVDYRDPDGAPVKEIRVLEQDQIAGAWTATHFTVRNVQRSHLTTVRLTGMSSASLGDDVFAPNRLDLGIPDAD